MIKSSSPSSNRQRHLGFAATPITPPLWTPPREPAELLDEAHRTALQIISEARAEATKLRAEAAAVRADADTAAEQATERAESARREFDRVRAAAAEELKAGQQCVNASRARAAQITADADKLLTDARAKADELLASARAAVEQARERAEQTEQHLDSERRTFAERVRQAEAEIADARRAASAEATALGEKIVADAEAAAQRIIADAEASSATMRSLSVETVERARAEADRIRSDERAETEQRARRDANVDKWSVRAIIGAAVGLTASGEYSLAKLVGFDPHVAWLLPLVIDIYVVQAFRRHRDIAPAIGLTVAVNVVYHLADAGLIGITATGKPEWWMIAIVASIASFILWRSHVMTSPRQRETDCRERHHESADEHATDFEVVRESEPESARDSALALPPETESPSLPPAREQRETASADSRETEVTETSENSSESESETERESTPKPRAARPRRESRKSQTGSQPRSDESVDTLLALMRKRGSADAVTIHDAERIVGKSYATNARKLAAARDLFTAEPANTPKDET